MTDNEVAQLKEELKQQKEAYQKLLDQKYVNIFHQPGTLFKVLKDSYGTVLQCTLCGSRGGTLSLTHRGYCRYNGTQVWYRSTDGQVSIYDVAMFDSWRLQ